MIARIEDSLISSISEEIETVIGADKHGAVLFQINRGDQVSLARRKKKSITTVVAIAWFRSSFVPTICELTISGGVLMG